MADSKEVALPLPSAPIVKLATNATLQPPLTRRGYGPGLILITPGPPPTDHAKKQKQTSNPPVNPGALDPLPQKKWAEEGYAVVQFGFENGEQSSEDWSVETGLGCAIEALRNLNTCNVKDIFGLIVYGTPSDYSSGFASRLKSVYETESKLIAAVCFSTDWNLSFKPELVHLPGSPSRSPRRASFPSARPHTRRHHYTSAKSSSFILPEAPDFHYTSASTSHARSLSFFKAQLGGPIYDLEAIWDEHTALEFATRSVAQTMSTMVDEPYVNHVPTITGGIGREALTNFYRNHFIFNNPEDMALELVSRTVGVNRVIDEFIAVCTHDRVIDWLLPGVPPTGKKLRMPFVSVVNIRGDRLYHEHIHWDQGTVLRQLGLLPDYLSFPYALPGGRMPAPGKRFEYRVPVAGHDTASKLEGEGEVQSNEMLGFEVREVDV
ncbi:hypothetical protein GGR57DRAFT_408333 [Xylariaceae sp. FL1272]|nr:hypothetical protein GGR57DRAFT_408333 [Xylariaceae sp. FL1272]